MAKSNPALEKKEEREHKDLDHDGEKGEPRSHQIKVLGKAKVTEMDNKKTDKKVDKKAEKPEKKVDAKSSDKDDKGAKKGFVPFTKAAPKPSEKAKKGKK